MEYTKLTPRLLIRLIREWEQNPGYDGYKVGDRVRFLTTDGWKTGSLTRRQLPPGNMRAIGSWWTVMERPGVLHNSPAFLMRSTTEVVGDR